MGTVSPVLAVTEDVTINAITTTFVQEAFTNEPILTEYFVESPLLPTQVLQVISIIGDAFDYLLDFDSIYNLVPVRTVGSAITLCTRHQIINADNATLLPGQDETDYDDVPPNGRFVGGFGYAASDTIVMDCDTLVTVDVVSGSVVTAFTVTTPATGTNFILDNIRRQVSTSGSGVDFTLFPSGNNTVLFGGAFITSTTVRTLLGTDAVGIDQQRNITSFLQNLGTGIQFNIGSFIFKARQQATDDITGTIDFRSIRFLKVKR